MSDTKTSNLEVDKEEILLLIKGCDLALTVIENEEKEEGRQINRIMFKQLEYKNMKKKLESQLKHL